MIQVKIKVNRAIAIPSNKIHERVKTLSIGNHMIDENELDHWFVQSLIKAKAIVVLGKTSMPEQKKPEKKKIEEAQSNIFDDSTVIAKQTTTIGNEELKVGRVVFNDLSEEKTVKKPKLKVKTKAK